MADSGCIFLGVGWAIYTEGKKSEESRWEGGGLFSREGVKERFIWWDVFVRNDGVAS